MMMRKYVVTDEGYQENCGLCGKEEHEVELYEIMLNDLNEYMMCAECVEELKGLLIRGTDQRAVS